MIFIGLPLEEEEESGLTCCDVERLRVTEGEEYLARWLSLSLSLCTCMQTERGSETSVSVYGLFSRYPNVLWTSLFIYSPLDSLNFSYSTAVCCECVYCCLFRVTSCLPVRGPLQQLSSASDCRYYLCLLIEEYYNVVVLLFKHSMYSRE